MNTQRLTISLPDYLYEQVMLMHSRGQISRFISEAVEKEIVTNKLERKSSPAEELLRLKKGLPKITRAKIMQAIARGRA